MRPERLELEGFTAFRERTVVDFADADLFAFTGPTGAGKSSLIDAMTFALYGSVPRLGAKAVAPVISKGKLEARVRLDFTVDGIPHTAVRVVRATPSGATTKEARLERRAAGAGHEHGDEVLASDAKGLTTAVEELLGLSFEHFTTCVVLPQGEFAALLHAEPRKRQDMLVQLLDLGVYDAMAQAARQRAAAAGAQIDVLDGQLAQYAEATDEAIQEAERRTAVLDRLVGRIDEARPRLEELAKLAAEASGEAAEAATRVAALGGLAVPDDVRKLTAKAKQGAVELDELKAAHGAAAGVLERAEAAVADRPDRAVLTEALARHRRRDELVERRAKGEARQVETAEALAAAAAARQAADADYARAKLALVEAQDRHRAEALAHTLEPGAHCPVCRQVVHDLPDHGPAPDLEAAGQDQEGAGTAAHAAADRERAAAREHDKVVDRLAEVGQEIADLDRQLADHGERAEVEAALAELDRVDAELRTARQTEQQRRRDRDAAEERAAALVAEETALWRLFDEKRDALAALGPPSTDRTDLGGAWQALVDWADTARPEQEERASAARARLDEAEAERATIDQRIRDTCAELDVALDGTEARDAATVAREQARQRHTNLVGEREKRRALADQRIGLVERRQVAEELGNHLRSDRFEKWILDEALQRLVGAATDILRQLTDTAYSLTLDGSTFAVVDHANADAIRSARTLSGGETFLASLALALALADQLADLAAAGSARLESIFCDEGFGSLDLDTLDVVATALEELGSQGRMVGVVSHVRELADRLPVRFEVRKGLTSATVERVEV
jgi:exonuclease SbcC